MTTPILDFVRAYAAGGTARMHMPGHGGRGPLGCEPVDITEIKGADDLSCPAGIIAESEANASGLFGSRATLYSTGGSSQCVKAMLLLAARRSGSRVILAARNAHKSFVHACALLDLRPLWLYPDTGAGSLCSCPVSPGRLRAVLAGMPEPPCAVYITSPDYLGGTQDIAGLAAAAHEFGVPLLTDNAHGAYLAFTEDGAHPLELGADLCCDSAHKTLAVLTGGAYLHISRDSAWDFERDAREAMVVFGSSSPSYLVLASLDAVNARLSGYRDGSLHWPSERFSGLKRDLASLGLSVRASDPMHVTIDACASGYTGSELAELLRAAGIEPEFADPDRLVLLPPADGSDEDLRRITGAFERLERRPPHRPLPAPEPAERVLTPREALFAARETVPVTEAAGRVMASAAVTCPPAVPVAVMGERISEQHVMLMSAYGLTHADVVR